jgi:hypothetical protein
MYFKLRAGAADQYRTGDNDYADEHIRAVHNDLSVAPVYIKRFLNLATNLVKSINDPLLSESAIDQMVMDARAEIIRTFPEIVWLQIKRDATRARMGTQLLLDNGS